MESKIMPLLAALREQKEMQMKGGIYHKTQIDLTYNSNHIEGSRLTHEQTRCIFESLALRYRQVLDYLRELAPFPIERLHVIGGGTYNHYLMQMTADSLGIPVITGPVEGTAIGNIMLQAKAAGLVADRFQMRHIIADSIDLKTYQPKDTHPWEEAYQRFIGL